MIRTWLGVIVGFAWFAHADGATVSCQSQVQIATERALQDVPNGNLKEGLEHITKMHFSSPGVTVIASEKKGRDEADADAEELSKRVEVYLDHAKPFYLGAGDTGQDFKVAGASTQGSLIREEDFLRKLIVELDDPEFDGLGNMALAVKFKASFVRQVLLSEKKIFEHQAITVYLDTTPYTVMRQGFYVSMDERGVTFPKSILNLDKLAQSWRSQVPVHFVVRANLQVIKPFTHSHEINLEYGPRGTDDNHTQLVTPLLEKVGNFTAGQSLYILTIPQPLKPL